MAKRTKKTPQKAAVSPTGTTDLIEGDLQEVDHFLQEMDLLSGESQALREEVEDEVAAGLRPKDDAQARSMAAALEQPVEALEQVKAGREAGKDRGKLFYTIELDKVMLAIRQDGMRAYVTQLAPEVSDESQAVEALKQCHLVDMDVRALKERQKQLHNKAPEWIQVAEGRPAVSGKSENIDFAHPNKPGRSLSLETLSLISMELHKLFRSQVLNKTALQVIRAVAVAPGEILARADPHPSRPAGTGCLWPRGAAGPRGTGFLPGTWVERGPFSRR